MCEPSRENQEASELMKRFASEMVALADDVEEFQILLPLLSREPTGASDPRLQILDALSQKVRALSQVASRMGEHGLCGKVAVGDMTRDVTLTSLAQKLSGLEPAPDHPSGELELF